MAKRLLRRYGWWVLTVLFLVRANALERDDLSVRIRARQSETGTMGPLPLELCVSNHSPTVVSGLPTFVDADIRIQYRRKGDPVWSSVHAPYFYLKHFSGETDLSPSRRLRIPAGSQLTAEYWLSYDMRRSAIEERSHYLFDPPGTYEVRVIHDTGLGSRIVSNTIEIRSVPYTGADKAAADWLQGLQYSHFLFERFRDRCVPTSKGRKIAAQLIEQHPGSCFIPWARLYLIRFIETPAADAETLERLQGEVDQIAGLNIPMLSVQAGKQAKRIEKRRRSAH